MLDARGLTKRYGAFLALDRVDFQVRRGEIVGYLGPNGSGKSTTVNTVGGLIVAVTYRVLFRRFERLMRFVAHSLVVGLAAYLLLTLTGAALGRAATAGAKNAAIIAVALSLVGYLLRRHRLAICRETPLMFEDEFPDGPQQLGL